VELLSDVTVTVTNQSAKDHLSGNGFLDGNFFFDNDFVLIDEKTKVKTIKLTIPLDSVIIAFGKADGHLVSFHRSKQGGNESSEALKQKVFEAGSLLSLSGDDSLEMRLTPNLAKASAACVSADLHIFAANKDMLTKCPHGVENKNAPLPHFEQEFWMRCFLCAGSCFF
jgi:hypothetical protein